MGIGGSFPGAKAGGVWSWLLQLVPRSSILGLYTHFPHTSSWQSASLVKHRDNFFLLHMYPWHRLEDNIKVAVEKVGCELDLFQDWVHWGAVVSINGIYCPAQGLSAYRIGLCSVRVVFKNNEETEKCRTKFLVLRRFHCTRPLALALFATWLWRMACSVNALCAKIVSS
jgi:hypothetical protein